MGLAEFGVKVSIFFIPFLLSLCIHEYAHGLVAKWKGDNTADYQGRLTLNPISHADPVGTFLLPLCMVYFGGPIIGWGKPVPVDERYMKNPKVDMFWVALAGPLANIIMGTLAAFLYALTTVKFSGMHYSEAVSALLMGFVSINFFLAIFNLIPVHPLDGGKVLARFLPSEINRKFEENQQIFGMILLFLMLAGALSIVFWPVRFIIQFLIVFFQSLLM